MIPGFLRFAKKHLALLVVVLAASFIIPWDETFAVAERQDNHQPNTKVRVIAESDEKASSAVERGCEVVRETRGLKALICAQEIASSLGLKEDIRIFKADTKANKQVGANVVQSSGDTGQGRKIVIIDTGYNYHHPELSSSYLGGKDFVNGDNDPMDDNGHGSHVAGLVTGDGAKWRAKGVAPAASIISAKILDGSGSGFFSDLVAAVYWAVDGPDSIAGTADDFKADAINLSIGTEPPYLYKNYCDSEMPSLTSAIKYAVGRGTIVVVAAGNYGTSGVSIPGCISHSFTVGAVNPYDKVASFSGRGKGVDISAPGTSLVSAYTGSDYATMSGTSMSAPVVSGVVALIKHEHPWYTPAKIQQRIINTALDLGVEGFDWSYGHGRVVAPAAVN